MAGDLVSAEVLTIPQVAQRLKVSRNTVYRLISAGELPVVEVGSVSRVSELDLKAYIDRNTRVAS
jgi:excisionase family DNA binding protein